MNLALASSEDFKRFWSVFYAMQRMHYAYYRNDQEQRNERCKAVILGRLEQLGTSGFSRVVHGCEVMIQHACKPESDIYEFNDKIVKAMKLLDSDPEKRIKDLEAENARLTAELEKQLAVSLDINAIIRDICELPDRSSPEDDPEAMIVMADELKAVLLSHQLPFQPLNIDDISDKTILKIVGAFWRRAVPREIPQPESIISITAMRTSLMWIDMDRYEDVELAKNHPLVFAVDSEGGHCD